MIRLQREHFPFGNGNIPSLLFDFADCLERFPACRREQIYFELNGEYAGAVRHERKGGVTAGAVKHRGDDTGMNETVLLGELLLMRQLENDDTPAHLAEGDTEGFHHVLAIETLYDGFVVVGIPGLK